MQPYRLWEPAGEPKGLVQILHGMAEHMGRYDRLARALNEQGYLVFGRNHRGHGPEAETLGYFADENGWDTLLIDAHADARDVRARYPKAPCFLLGFSMGSFLARQYALEFGGELDGLILAGTGYYSRALSSLGILLARLSPQKKPAHFVDGIAFSGNNKPFSPSRTAFDWLSRDEKEVDKYLADPLCGFCFTGKAFSDFFGCLEALTHEDALQAMTKELPVYFVSGEKDPVGQMGKGVKKVAEQFRRAGMQDVTVTLYPDARHEVFNEINRDEATKALIAWLNDKSIGKTSHAGD